MVGKFCFIGARQVTTKTNDRNQAAAEELSYDQRHKLLAPRLEH